MVWRPAGGLNVMAQGTHKEIINHGMVRHVGLASKPRAGRSQGRSDYQGHAATLGLVHCLYDRRGALGLVYCFNYR